MKQKQQQRKPVRKKMEDNVRQSPNITPSMPSVDHGAGWPKPNKPWHRGNGVAGPYAIAPPQPAGRKSRKKKPYLNKASWPAGKTVATPKPSTSRCDSCAYFCYGSYDYAAHTPERSPCQDCGKPTKKQPHGPPDRWRAMTCDLCEHENEHNDRYCEKCKDKTRIHSFHLSDFAKHDIEIKMLKAHAPCLYCVNHWTDGTETGKWLDACSHGSFGGKPPFCDSSNDFEKFEERKMPMWYQPIKVTTPDVNGERPPSICRSTAPEHAVYNEYGVCIGIKPMSKENEDDDENEVTEMQNKDFTDDEQKIVDEIVSLIRKGYAKAYGEPMDSKQNHACPATVVKNKIDRDIYFSVNIGYMLERKLTGIADALQLAKIRRLNGIKCRNVVIYGSPDVMSDSLESLRDYWKTLVSGKVKTDKTKAKDNPENEIEEMITSIVKTIRSVNPAWMQEKVIEQIFNRIQTSHACNAFTTITGMTNTYGCFTPSMLPFEEPKSKKTKSKAKPEPAKKKSAIPGLLNKAIADVLATLEPLEEKWLMEAIMHQAIDRAQRRNHYWPVDERDEPSILRTNPLGFNFGGRESKNATDAEEYFEENAD